MEKKRKRTFNEEEIKRKIMKWERKLLKPAQPRSRCIIYSSDDDETTTCQSESSRATSLARDSNRRSSTPVPEVVHVTADVYAPPPRSGQSPHPPPPSLSASPLPPPRAPSPPPSPRAPSPRATSPTPGTADHAAENEIPTEETQLDDDILQLLGEAPKSDTPLGPPIHKDVATRWQEILAKGLTKEVKDKISAEYLIPSNCDFLIAPTLNPEAKAALSEPLVKRDTFLMNKQKQLGIALSALASATTLILANETSKQKLLKPISDACRILCDNHYTETKSRRNLVISATNMQLKDTLIESVRDKTWLFGENITEKLKAAKSIQRSGDDLKNHSRQTTKPIYQGKNNRGRLNYKPQHRKTDNKPVPNTGRGRTQARAPPARSTPRSSRRSPPPRRNYNK